jgi:SpoVK/Ycf46/Vps4 family AAA+-type ATPase
MHQINEKIKKLADSIRGKNLDSTVIDVYQENDTRVSSKSVKFTSRVTFDTLHFPGKELLVSEIDKVESGENKKLTVLLYGEPGCGKTSVIKSIINYTKRNVINVKFRGLDLVTLKSVMFDTRYAGHNTEKKIVVIEDVDCDSKVTHERRDNSNRDKNTKLTLSNILEIFDGIIELNDTILIMTTNYPERLDDALIRDGRVDLRIHMGRMSGENAMKIIRGKFPEYNESIPDGIFTLANIHTACKQSKTIDELNDRLRDIARTESATNIGD